MQLWIWQPLVLVGVVGFLVLLTPVVFHCVRLSEVSSHVGWGWLLVGVAATRPGRY